MSKSSAKWINITNCPYEGFPSEKGTLRIGRASSNVKRSREIEDPQNIFLNNPVISANHIEFYKTSSNNSLCLINKSRNGFFLIDEDKNIMSYINGKDNSEYLKNGNIIALCFSKKYLKDYQDGHVIGDEISTTLQECKILIQIYTDYSNGLIANIFDYNSYTSIRKKQFENALLYVFRGKNKKNFNNINKIFKKVCDEQNYYCKSETIDDNYFYNSEINDSNSSIDDSNFSINEKDQDDIFENRLEEKKDDAKFKKFKEFCSSESDSNTKYSTDFEERDDSTHDNAYDITQIECGHFNVQKYEPNKGNMNTKPIKRSYDESNCFDGNEYEESQRKIRKLSSVCDSQTKEIEELKKKIEKLTKSKKSVKLTALGFLSGVTTTMLALYHIGSKK